METLVQAQPVTPNHQPNISVMPVPEPQQKSENLDASSQPFATGSKPHLFYKCLLNQHAQKLRKPLPVYHTQNEGYDHLPRFRSTVLIDGVTYTSSNTFHQRKMAEMDASKAAYIAIIQKLKSDALRFIQEDKFFSKSILAEYGAKLNIGKPEYETTHLEGSVPVFRSSVRFNGVVYVGDNGKSKKEAEQLAARAVVLSYLDSESGTDMAEIINCKARYYVELNKVQEINNAHNDTNVLGTQTGVNNEFASTVAKPESGTGTMAKSSAVPEQVLVQVTTAPATFPSSGVTPPPIPQTSIEPITPAVAVVTQPPIPQTSVEPITPAVAVVTQPPIPQTSVEPITPVVAFATRPHIPEVSVDPIKPVRMHLALAQTASAEVKTSSAPLANIPATNIPSVVIQPAHSDVAAQTLEYIPLTGQTSERKRQRKNKKKAQKKMRVDAQIPVAPANQVPPFSSQ